MCPWTEITNKQSPINEVVMISQTLSNCLIDRTIFAYFTYIYDILKGTVQKSFNGTGCPNKQDFSSISLKTINI